MLEVRDIVKRLPGGRTLLKGISFRLDRGEFVGILGPSGAGKSLTVRCILGLTRPDSGEVVLWESPGCARPITHSSRPELRRIRQRIGVVFQGAHLVRRLSVLENVMIGGLGGVSPLRSWVYGFTDEEAHRAMEVLKSLSMTDFAQRRASTLSGGEMQRVALARVLYQDPLLLLADEPIGSLDPRNANDIMRLLQDISRQIPVCGVFHQPEITARYCTRIIGIRDGRVIYDGCPCLSHGQLESVYGDELQALEEEAGVPRDESADSGEAEADSVPRLIEG